MATFVIVHGAWGGGFSWRKIGPLLTAKGHTVLTPTLTGLGERAHLASAAVDLETHVSDVVGVLETEDLRDVILLGHSYGGMVVTGVADRVPARIAHLAYLDAFAPQDGDSVMSLQPAENARAMQERLVDGWRLPPNPLAADTPEAEREWLAARRHDQPFATFTQQLRLTGAAAAIPRTYIYCLRKGLGDTFGPFAARARSEAGWRYREIDASHGPNITAPEALADLLLEMAD